MFLGLPFIYYSLQSWQQRKSPRVPARLAGRTWRRDGGPLSPDTGLSDGLTVSRHADPRSVHGTAYRCGLTNVTSPRREDATARTMSLIQRRGRRRSIVNIKATDVSEDRRCVDVHSVVDMAHTAVYTINTCTISYIHLGERCGTDPIRWDLSFGHLTVIWPQTR